MLPRLGQTIQIGGLPPSEVDRFTGFIFWFSNVERSRSKWLCKGPRARGRQRALRKIAMQPTTHKTISETTFTGIQGTPRPGMSAGLRTRAVYGFLILALCLMIADFCRLTRAHAAEPFSAPSSHQTTRL